MLVARSKVLFKSALAGVGVGVILRAAFFLFLNQLLRRPVFCSRTLTTAFFLTLFVPLASHGADILWWTGELEEEKDVSNFGTVVEAFAFTGERDNNALDGTYPLEDPFYVNGTSFTPLNLTFGDEPEFLGGWTMTMVNLVTPMQRKGWMPCSAVLLLRVGSTLSSWS